MRLGIVDDRGLLARRSSDDSCCNLRRLPIAAASQPKNTRPGAFVRELGIARLVASGLKNSEVASRKRLSEVLGEVRRFAAAEKWGPANLAIDVDPMTLL